MANEKLDPTKNLFLPEILQLCREIYKKQHYIVIGWPAMPIATLAVYQPGWKTTILFQYDLGYPFEAVEYGTAADWKMQNALIRHLRPTWIEFPDIGSTGHFLRMKPVGVKK